MSNPITVPVMSTAQWASLRERAIEVMPPHERKQDILMVAVMKTPKSATSLAFKADDFLWVKCKRNTLAARIAQQIREIVRKSADAFILTHEGKPVSFSATAGSLDTRGDGLILLDVADGDPLLPVEAREPQLPLSPRDPNVQPPIRLSTSGPSLGDENAEPYGSTTVLPCSPRSQLRSTNLQNVHSATACGQHDFQNMDIQSTHATPTAVPVQSSPHASSDQHSSKSSQADRDGWRIYWRNYYGDYRKTYPSEREDQIKERISQAWHASLKMSDQERLVHQPRVAQALDLSKETLLPAVEQNPPTASHVEASVNGTEDAPKVHSQPVAEPTLAAAEIQEQGQKNFQLPSLIEDASPQDLESVVEASVTLLNNLKAPLVEKMDGAPDAQQWIQQIEILKKQAVKTKTVIGVVGNTGAGKSSVINAMLDEERLVPTNCMRACTAVVTEISYNYEDRPYVAQIEFITLADWEKELNVLFQDLLDGEGKVSRDCSNEDTDAGIAYAKIKAVYPNKTKDDLASSNIRNLLQDVSPILGGSRDIKETDSLIFYRKLQSFVDSKEKSIGKKDRDGKAVKKEREYWPLIRVVRLYVRSPALATGAVIVDLPGVHDANAARAAVAESYLKQCTGLWIVAPITRAVDDKAAKSLLGESFKRQLKMDGGFNAVTFICSKTDDISLIEAQDSLGLDEQMQPSWEKIDSLAAMQKDLKKRLEDMEEMKTVYEEVANDADEQIEEWESIRESVSKGRIVYAPKPLTASKKRKDSNHKGKARKKRRTDSNSDGSDFFDDDSDAGVNTNGASDGSLSDQETSESKPLTQVRVDEKLQELKNTKKNGRIRKQELNEKMADLRTELNESKEAEKKIEAEMAEMCISGRNQYSRGAIQQDFAAGIKELDQEIAAEEDEENFDPENEARDYEEVATSLPVFCVSSRGYQKLQGRLRKDPNVPGFRSIEETEIPQLQAHCEKLTETGRVASCRTFINKLSQLLNSLTLWASSDGTGAHITAEHKAKEARYLQKGLDVLETGLEDAIKTTCNELSNRFDDSIFDKSEAAVRKANETAIETTMKWGAPVDRENRAEGGLHWCTYKAICRRYGCYSNTQGLHNWNAQLSEPMIRMLMPGWERCFGRRLQTVMNYFIVRGPRCLRKFHKDIEARVQKMGGNTAGLAILNQQVDVYIRILKDLASTAKDMISSKQKDINREFVPIITKHMNDAYDGCVAEYGTGSFKRMKNLMNSHVAQERHTMFQSSVDHVQKLLKDLVKETNKTMSDKADEVFVQIQRDYRSILGGADASQQGEEVLPKVQRQVRKEIRKLIEGVEKRTKSAMGEAVEDSGDEEEHGAEDVEQMEECHEKSEEGTRRKVREDANTPNSKTFRVGEDQPADSQDRQSTPKAKGGNMSSDHPSDQAQNGLASPSSVTFETGHRQASTMEERIPPTAIRDVNVAEASSDDETDGEDAESSNDG